MDVGSLESEVETGDVEGVEEGDEEGEEGDADGEEERAEVNPVDVGTDGAVEVPLDAALPLPVPVPNEAIAGPGNT